MKLFEVKYEVFLIPNQIASRIITNAQIRGTTEMQRCLLVVKTYVFYE